MSNWCCVNGHLIVKPELEKNVTNSGLLLAPSQKRADKGTVLHVGKPAYTHKGFPIPSELSVGDRIVFNPMIATVLKNGNDVIYILPESHVYGKIENSENFSESP